MYTSIIRIKQVELFRATGSKIRVKVIRRGVQDQEASTQTIKTVQSIYVHMLLR
jgi:hypothetical protein